MRSRMLVLLAVLAPGVAGGVPGLSDTMGNDATLVALQALRRFEGFEPGQFTSQLWFDPYAGDDVTGTGTYDAPFRSFAKMKERCVSYTRCTVKGRDRVFSPLTLTMSGSADYVADEVLVWADGSGTALAWDPPTRSLVVASLGGTDPPLASVISGASSGAAGAVIARSDTLGGIPALTIEGFSDADDQVQIANHPYANGQGPVRLFTSDTLPTGLARSIDYYACAVGTNSFQLSTSPTCTPITTFAGSGSGTHMVVGRSNTRVVYSIVPACADRDRICILFESEFPESKARIDGNGYYPVGVTLAAAPSYWPGSVAEHYAVPIGGTFVVAGDGTGGWVGVQNIDVQNLALDAFSTESGVGSVGKLVTLNSRAIDIRNGFSDRSTGNEAMGHNSCFSSTGSGEGTGEGGILYAINAGASNNDSGNVLGSGACINPGQESAMRLLGTGPISVNGIDGDGNCEGHPCWSPVIVAPGADLVIIGHDLLASQITHSVVMATHSNRPQGWRQQWARVFAHLRNPFDTYAAAIGLHGDGSHLTQVLREVTARFESPTLSTFLVLCSFPNAATAAFSYQGVLVDDADFWIRASNCGWNTDSDSNFYQTSMEWEGIYDDDDDTSGTTEWSEEISTYATLDAFRTAVEGILARNGRPTTQWQLLRGDSFDSGGPGEDGHQWGSPPDPMYRCQPDRECWYGYDTPYTIELTTIYGADPDDACLPADVMGARICSFRLTPTHIGSRALPDADRDTVTDGEDDCLLSADANQLDSDQDGFGNACDADFDDDGIVGVPDWLVLARAFGTSLGSPGYDPELDSAGDGAIGEPEFLLLGASFTDPPGPSGLVCAGTPPCP